MQIERSAMFGSDHNYRYRLTRKWDMGEGYVNFVMLNPSTADSLEDDATIRTCMGFAQRWGYEGIKVTNLFALRSIDPNALYAAKDPVGIQNNSYIAQTAMDCAEAGVIVCAWGNGPDRRMSNRRTIVEDRELYVLELLMPIARLNFLELTKLGVPSHALYKRRTLRPREFDARQRCDALLAMKNGKEAKSE